MVKKGKAKAEAAHTRLKETHEALTLNALCGSRSKTGLDKDQDLNMKVYSGPRPRACRITSLFLKGQCCGTQGQKGHSHHKLLSKKFSKINE